MPQMILKGFRSTNLFKFVSLKSKFPQKKVNKVEASNYYWWRAIGLSGSQLSCQSQCVSCFDREKGISVSSSLRRIHFQ